MRDKFPAVWLIRYDKEEQIPHGKSLHCLLNIEKKLREEVVEENFAAGFALGWEIRKELQDAGVLSIENGEHSGTVISERV